MTHLAISIPVYNDAATVAPLVRESLAVLSQITPSHEVFLINDGSRDESAQVLQKLAAEHPAVRVLEHDRNYGFGRTIREVYTLPQSEWIFFIPGDGQIPPSELLKLYPHRDRYSFILGHRKHRNDPPSRKFTSFCYNTFVSLLAGRRIRDVNSVGLLKRAALEDANLISTSAFIHAEILLAALRRDAAVAEIEIEHKPRTHGKASGNKWRVILPTARDLLRYFVRQSVMPKRSERPT